MDYDVVIVGGSFAGLSAALYLGRARRRVLVLDTGTPRNRFADHAHGVLGRDGTNPLALRATAREQVAAYPTVHFLDRAAVDVTGGQNDFFVTLDDGAVVRARRLILAYGVTDSLPDIPGLRMRWGKSVIHCPYCHGYEFSDRALGVLAMGAGSFHQAQLIPEWGPTTLFLNGGAMPEPGMAATLAGRGVRIEPAPVLALEGEGSALERLVLADGRSVSVAALYVAPELAFSSDLAERLGCALTETPMGRIIATDELRMTSVAGVWAAGDITRMAHSVTWASADGVTAGTAAHRSLVFPDA